MLWCQHEEVKCRLESSEKEKKRAPQELLQPAWLKHEIRQTPNSNQFKDSTILYIINQLKWHYQPFPQQCRVALPLLTWPEGRCHHEREAYDAFGKQWTHNNHMTTRQLEHRGQSGGSSDGPCLAPDPLQSASGSAFEQHTEAWHVNVREHPASQPEQAWKPCASKSRLILLRGWVGAPYKNTIHLKIIVPQTKLHSAAIASPQELRSSLLPKLNEQWHIKVRKKCVKNNFAVVRIMAV